MTYSIGVDEALLFRTDEVSRIADSFHTHTNVSM